MPPFPLLILGAMGAYAGVALYVVPSLHFSWKELTESTTAAKLGISNEPGVTERLWLYMLCILLEWLRAGLQAGINITSGFRHQKVQDALREQGRTATVSSDHTRGQAVDLYASGWTNEEIAAWIWNNWATAPLGIGQVIVERHTGHLHFSIAHNPFARARPEFLQTSNGTQYTAWRA